jgi:aminoglycoside 3-N-acetyltransferase
MEHFTKNKILNDLRALGINRGDIVFVTANILKVGLFGTNRKAISRNWVDVFKELVGPRGGVVAVSYSKAFHRLRRDPKCIFTRESRPTSGGLSNIFVADTQFTRSTHPTNSYIGYGDAVVEILKQHNHNGMSYDVPLQLINMGCKNLLLGTVDEVNAPMAMHVAQQLVGDTLKHPTNFLLQSFYLDDGTVRLFTRKDAAGCSGAGRKFFEYLYDRMLVTDGYVGNAYSAVIPGAQSLEAALNIRKQRSTVFCCADSSCSSCYPSLLSKIPSRFFRWLG